MLIKASGPVKLAEQLKCYTYKTMKSNKQANEKSNESFLKSILLKKPNTVNISFT